MSEISPPPPMMGRPDPEDPEAEQDKRGTMRALVEAFVSLFIAVLLFRTFAAEGYMISTGSMAPSLLGYHKRVTCPTCGITFPFGTAYDTDDASDADSVLVGRSRVICPNCGQPGIDISEVPRNHGDQLLVNKQAYLNQSPRRWDIAVFRNPARPTEAYVKRVVGLPGERIQIVGGDVTIDGEIARKSFEQQLATRILVYDHEFQPANDEEFQPHWQPSSKDASSSPPSIPAAWVISPKSFTFRGRDVRRPEKEPVAWVEYHHWLRAEGHHDTVVALESWPEEIEPHSVPKIGLRFDPKKHEFGLTGVLPLEAARQLMQLTDDKPFRNAVCELYEASHIVPVTDNYGYNPNEETGAPIPVRDLMFSSQIDIMGGTGEFLVEMTNGATRFSVLFDAVHREVHLHVEPVPPGEELNSTRAEFGPQSDPVASGPWPASLGKKNVEFDFSLFDKQVVVSINGEQAFPAWKFELPSGALPPRIPVRFGARGIDVRLSKVKLYRDIFYTETRSRHAINRPYELKSDEYFVLGDNSPVSHDSRRWESPVVRKSLMVGKPFLVHLPSKPGNLQIGNREIHLRIPDWDRIRFLR